MHREGARFKKQASFITIGESSSSDCFGTVTRKEHEKVSFRCSSFKRKPRHTTKSKILDKRGNDVTKVVKLKQSDVSILSPFKPFEE